MCIEEKKTSNKSTRFTIFGMSICYLISINNWNNYFYRPKVLYNEEKEDKTDKESKVSRGSKAKKKGDNDTRSE